MHDAIAVALANPSQALALGQILAEQAIEVLVAAALPWMMRVRGEMGSGSFFANGVRLTSEPATPWPSLCVGEKGVRLE